MFDNKTQTSKIKLSTLIAGTMSWGSWGKKFKTQEMAKLIHLCLDNTISSFDHADIYGDYTTELDFGKAFVHSGINRDNIQLISKCGIQLINEERKNTVKHYNYSYKYIIESVDQSLIKLHTHYIDLFLLHRPSPLMHTDEIAKAIDILTSSGKILSFGVSNFTSSQTALLHQKVNISYNQIEFSLSHNNAMLDGSLDYMQTNGITPMCWAPLGDIFKEKTNTNNEVLKVVKELSEKYKTSEEAILIAWILKHPSNILPVFGTTNAQRIKNISKAIEIELDLQDWFLLWTASAGNAVP